MKTMTYSLHNDLDKNKSWANLTEEEGQELTQTDFSLAVCSPKGKRKFFADKQLHTRAHGESCYACT
jgi:hypothetical protein